MQYFDKNGKEIKAGLEICPSEQEIRTELEELAPIIEGTELALDYGEKVSKEDYEKYEAAISTVCWFFPILLRMRVATFSLSYCIPIRNLRVSSVMFLLPS